MMDPSITPAFGLVPAAPVGDDLAALLGRASRGDEQAFTDLYDRSPLRHERHRRRHAVTAAITDDHVRQA